MLNKKIVYIAFFAGFMPVVSFGRMAYVIPRGCNCHGNGCSCASQNDANKYRIVKKDSANQYGSQDDQVISDKKVAYRNDWYVGLNATMNMWSWENEYTSNYPGQDLVFNTDSYSFKPVFGGSVVAGKYFDAGFRGDLEFGLLSSFSDSDDTAKFSLSAPYMMLNGYYDFDCGVYLGAGVGIVRSSVKLEGDFFDASTGAKHSSWAPKVGAAIGYSLDLYDNVVLDFRYRLSGFNAASISRGFSWNNEHYTLKVNTGLVIENALSMGIRYSF